MELMEAIERLECMALDRGETWDLSDNDREAIERVLDRLAVHVPWDPRKAMNCSHCNKPISRTQLAQGLGKIKSEAKAKSSAENGKLGGRPKNPPKS